MENNNNSLYAISNSFIELLDSDISEEEMQARGQELAEMLRNKSEAIVSIDIDLNSYIESIDREIERLKAKKEEYKAKEAKLKEYVKGNMERMNLQKIDTALGRIAIKKNPASVEITDERLISPEYYNEKIVKTIDKTRIKKDLQAGMQVLGANLIENKTRLDIG